MHTKSDLPLVSVIIPLYNASKYIKQTLTSVVNQTYQNIEIIVIDHASSDNSLAKLEEMSDSIHNLSIIRCNENKGGPAFPRNIGINVSKGDYIAFLDSDDVWENNKIETQINVAIQDKYNFICSKAILIDGESYPIQKSFFYKYKRKKDITINQLLYRNQIITSSVMIKRALLSGLNFNEDEELITCEDLHLWLQIINTDFCKPVMLQQNLLKLRVISTSLGSVSGRLIFAVKYLFASMKFLIRTNNIKLVYIPIVSFMLRVIKIKLSTIFNNKN